MYSTTEIEIEIWGPCARGWINGSHSSSGGEALSSRA